MAGKYDPRCMYPPPEFLFKLNCGPILPVVVWWGLSILTAIAAVPGRILILNPHGREVEPFGAVVTAFRSTLAREAGQPVDFLEIPLDLTRFNEAEGERPLAAFLEQQLDGHPVDLVVALGGAGSQFAERHRERLFPASPVLVCAAEPRLIPPRLPGSNATLVTQRIDLAGFVRDILEIKPETAHLAVVMGNSPVERFWLDACRREFAPFGDRLKFIWLDGLPLDEVVRRCAALPPDSFIFHGLFNVDGYGISCEKNEALHRLCRTANAPVYALFESEFGFGPVGGRLYRNREIGELSARTAVRILRGEKAGSIPPVILEAASPRYDWRVLERWGIREENLPANRMVDFRQPGFWQQYRNGALGALAFALVQSGLIFGLLAGRSRRRRSEAEAALIAGISSKFVNLRPDEVDGEILDAQRRLCELLGMDMAVLWQWEDRPPGRFIATHVHYPQDGPQPPAGLSDDLFPWCRQQILANRIVACRCLADLPAEAARDRETARRLGIKSHLTIPLSVGGAVPLGMLSFKMLRTERSWPSALINRLRLVAQIFANALARKQADEQRRASGVRLSLATESAGAGLWELDWDRQQFQANEKAREIFGYEPDGEIGMARLHDSVHPEDWEAVETAIRRAVEEGEPIDVEYRIRPSGNGDHERWVVSRGRPVFREDGRPECLIGLSMDITRQRRAEETLRQLSLAVAQSPVLVLITDPKGRIIYVNRKFTEVTGYAPEECLGRTPRMLKSGESPPAIYQEMWSCISRGETWRGELHNKRKNGELYWERAKIAPVVNAAGRVTHYVGVKEDITAQRLREKEAVEQREELFHLSRVASLGQLSGSLAHELNQPLGIILTNAQAAQRMLAAPSPDLAELREILADIIGEDIRAGEVITRLRALLKRGETKLLPLSLNEVILQVIGLLRSELIARGVTVQTSLADGLPPVPGDEVQLQQLLINLITNACDAMEGYPPPQRLVTLSTQPMEDGVRLSVRDQGGGLPAEDPNRIFQPFVTTKPNGMGIGLSICQSIVAAHHGQLHAHRRPEGGTVFHLDLHPLRPPAPAGEFPVKSSGEPAAPAALPKDHP